MIHLHASAYRAFRIESSPSFLLKLFNNYVFVTICEGQQVIFVTTEYLHFLNQNHPRVVCAEIYFDKELFMEAISLQLVSQNGLTYHNGKIYLYNSEVVYLLTVVLKNDVLEITQRSISSVSQDAVLRYINKENNSIQSLLRSKEFFAVKTNDAFSLRKSQQFDLMTEFEIYGVRGPKQTILQSPGQQPRKTVSFSLVVSIMGGGESELNGATRSGTLFDDWEVIEGISVDYCEKVCKAFSERFKQLACK